MFSTTPAPFGSRRGSSRRSAAFLLAASGLLVGLHVTAASARAQTALGDGHALDANNSATGSRYNTPVRDISAQIRFNNAIITGQAAGGRAFRGDVGYGAASEFRGSTAADTLYTFERDSAYSRLAGTGVRGTDALRYQFALSTGGIVPQSFAGTTGAYARSPVSTGAAIDTRVPPSAGGSILRSTSQFLTQRSITPTIVGYRSDPDGASYGLSASPLTGVSVYKLEQREVKKSAVPGAETEQESPADKARSLNPRERNLKVMNPYTGVESSAAGLPSTIDQFGTGEVAKIDTAVPTTLVQPVSMLHGQVLSRSKSAYDAANTRNNPAAAGRDGIATRDPQATDRSAPAGSGLTWDEQLVRMRAALRGESPEQAILQYHREKLERDKAAKAASATGAATGTGADGASSTSGPLTGAGDATSSSAATPDPNLTTPGEDGRSAVGVGNDTQVTGGGADLARIEADRVKRELAAMESAGRKLGLSDATLQALKAGGVRFERLDEGLNPQAKLGEQDAQYFEHIRAGQAFMAQRKYFDAEERFTRALASVPGDPMAAIGRMHAQLGAGLFLSSAMNLRRIIADHPEFANSTFAPELIPSAERLAEVRARLLDEIVKAGTNSALGKDSGLMLAYVGHISSDRPTVIRGLREFVRRIPDGDQKEQALGEFLARVWLTETVGGAAGAPGTDEPREAKTIEPVTSEPAPSAPAEPAPTPE